MPNEKTTVVEDGYEVVPEPDWGVLMFWEDLTYIFTLIADFFKKLFGLTPSEYLLRREELDSLYGE